MSVTDRIPELLREGEAAIAQAATTDQLEDVRVRFLARKAELPNLLRGVAELPPEERGPVGRAANEAARPWRRRSRSRAASWRWPSSTRGSRATGSM